MATLPTCKRLSFAERAEANVLAESLIAEGVEHEDIAWHIVELRLALRWALRHIRLGTADPEGFSAEYNDARQLAMSEEAAQ